MQILFAVRSDEEFNGLTLGGAAVNDSFFEVVDQARLAGAESVGVATKKEAG